MEGAVEVQEVAEGGGEVDRNLMYKLEKSVMLTSSKVYAFSAWVQLAQHLYHIT